MIVRWQYYDATTLKLYAYYNTKVLVVLLRSRSQKGRFCQAALKDAVDRSILQARAQDAEARALLKGSWDLITRFIIRVTALITTYNPNSKYLQAESRR